MKGVLRSLKAGEQGGGIKRQLSGGTSSQVAGAKQPRQPRAAGAAQAPWQASRLHQRNVVDAAIRREIRSRDQDVRAREQRVHLPEWIRPGEHVGYVSRSTGKVAEVIIEKVSRADGVVKIVFAEDREIWKGIPFSMIMSRSNPLKRLAATGSSGDTNDMLNRAQATQVDKSIMLQRAVGAKESPVAGPLVGERSKKVIPDSAITASSYFMNNPRHGFGQMWRTRLDNIDSAWRAAADTVSQCLRWDFGSVKKVVMVGTKGNFAEDQWVTEYDLSFSEDGTTWTRLHVTFKGNQDRDSLVENPIDPPILASSVKLHPAAWHEHISMRAELYGFAPEEEEEEEEDAEEVEPIGPVLGPALEGQEGAEDAEPIGPVQGPAPEREEPSEAL